MEKIKSFDAALIGFDIVAGTGVDVFLTSIAKAVIPKSVGLPGIIQAICIKTASIGHSFVATDAIDRVIRNYAKEISEEIQKELEKESSNN